MPAPVAPTRSSRQTAAAVITANPNSKQNAIWTEPDVVAFLDFLISRASSAGDGGNFKMPVFKAAAPVVNAVRTRGGIKTAKSCHGKFKGVRFFELGTRTMPLTVLRVLAPWHPLGR